jgi:lipoyl-dependent peroxiredoxin
LNPPPNQSGSRISRVAARIQLRTIKCEATRFRIAQNQIVRNACGAEIALTGETTMSVNVLYKTSAKATGGRDGHAATLDGALDVKLTTPKELGGGGGAGNNPEQLFAAGYAACFIGAMKFVSSQGGPKVPADASVISTVGIGPRSEGGFGLTVELAVSLPGVPRAEAEALVEKAHHVCPYSNATRGNVDVRLSVV